MNNTSSNWKWPFIVLSLFTVLIIVVSFFIGLDGKPAENPQGISPTKPSPTASATPPAETVCPAQFEQVAGNNASHRVDADFSTKYAEATVQANNLTEAQRTVLLENSANNAQRLAIWSYAFGLYENPNVWDNLVEDNCLSSDGQKLYYQLEGVLTAKGTVFEEGEAPSNGHNSGVDNNGDYGVGGPGVHGDRTAIKITLPDGTVVWIMVRCGNAVFPGPPTNLPKVPTDDPGPKGNAPEGEGVNQDPGPGTYIPPEEMEQPPAAPRVNPPAPKPAPSTPPKESTPDPAPAPVKEAEAPAPDEPGEVIPCAPGVETC